MGQRKFTLYKDVKIARRWQKAEAAFYSNSKIKPNIIIYKGKEQEHPEGAYYVNDRGKWIFSGKDALNSNEVGHTRAPDSKSMDCLAFACSPLRSDLCRCIASV
jgi:hypothetical protein